jgi:tripartite-type tricarboxylate transporter receptor subunit TctC
MLASRPAITSINPSLYKKVPYNAIKDFAPVTLLATVLNVLVVGKTVSAKNVGDLIKVTKEKGDGANMGSAGSGTPGHLAAEMFRESAKLKFTHVPYKGGAPTITDLKGGQIDFLFTTVPGVISHIKSGALRPLAVRGGCLVQFGGDIALERRCASSNLLRFLDPIPPSGR